MANTPFLLEDITDPQYLFGRDVLLKKLEVAVNLRQNVNIIGARRFGKTCLVKCMHTILRNDARFKTYPVYFDFKEAVGADVKGSVQAYAYMVSNLVANLCRDGHFTEPQKFGLRLIVPSIDYAEVFEQFEGMSSPALQNLLQNVVAFYAEKLDSMILFIMDEYECLFSGILDTPHGFAKIRTMSSMTSNFRFWLVGATPWDVFTVQNEGSGDANTVGSTEYVPGINREAFARMWSHECALVEDDGLRKYLADQEDFVFEKSGGVPFYAKIQIGFYMYKERALPDYMICVPFFNELVKKTIQSEEYDILKAASLGTGTPTGPLVPILKRKGLLASDADARLYVPIRFLAEYIAAKESESDKPMPPQGPVAAAPSADDSSDEETPDSIILEIERLYELIERANPQLFDSSKEDLTEFRTIRKECDDEASFGAFMGSVYRLYYESSGCSDGPNRHLPDKFFYSSTMDLIRSLRNHFQHRNCEERILKADKMWSMVNDGRELIDAADFGHARMVVLMLWRQELQTLLDGLKGKGGAPKPAAAGVSAKPQPVKRNVPEAGTRYTGTLARNPQGKYFIQNEFNLPLYVDQSEIRGIKIGETVKFMLQSSPNLNNPNKTFWKACSILKAKNE